VELLAGIVDARDLDHACATAVGDLARLLNCRCAAVGLRRGGSGRCRLRAISGVASVDKRSETARLFEAALDEALLRGDTTVWPPQDDQQRLGLLAHKGLCTTEGAATIISVPLRGDDSDAIGGLVAVFDRADQSCTRAQALLHAAERPVATALDARQRLQPGRVARLFASTMGCWKSRRGRWTALAACLVVAAMAAPLPYKIACDCRVEPVARRFVAAPFDGRLDRALVKPGDVVRKGQVLAQMDGHEIRCELAGVEADRSRAAKQRDAAMAAHEYADAQIAGLQVQRCDLQLRVLNDRTQRLEVRSPVDGIVTTGDLQRVEGAALAVGQTLFEIAPLEEMVVEVDVSDDDVSHVVDGQVVHVRLDAYPTQTWLAPIDKLHPRSRIRDQQNVFVAEAMLNNADGRLRPGMKGRAKIVTPRRPLGWILLHKPWQWLTKTTTW